MWHEWIFLEQIFKKEVEKHLNSLISQAWQSLTGVINEVFKIPWNNEDLLLFK